MRDVRILGVVDEVGGLYCEACRPITDYNRGYVWSDQTAHVDEACDGCGTILSAPLNDPRNRFQVRAVHHASLGTVWRIHDDRDDTWFVTCTGAKHFYSAASARASAANLNS